MSPLVQYLPELVPKESQIARFQLILPTNLMNWSNKGLKPLCLHLAGTGDHVLHLVLNSKFNNNYLN